MLSSNISCVTNPLLKNPNTIKKTLRNNPHGNLGLQTHLLIGISVKNAIETQEPYDIF